MPFSRPSSVIPAPSTYCVHSYGLQACFLSWISLQRTAPLRFEKSWRLHSRNDPEGVLIGIIKAIDGFEWPLGAIPMACL